MPFAPKIRKDVLHALEHSIIPVLQAQSIGQVFVGYPFDFSHLKHWVLQEELLPDNAKGPLQVIRRWPEQQLVASRSVSLSFLYEGSQHVKVGVLASMVKGREKPDFATNFRGETVEDAPALAGVYAVVCSAPTAVLSSPFVPHEDGSPCDLLLQDVSKTMSIIFDRDEVLIFHSSRNRGQFTSSHHLCIQDRQLFELGQIYHQELQEQVSLEGAQGILLAIALRLRYHLIHSKPGISNSCWLDPVVEFEKALSQTELRHQALCQDVIDYIQNHLHEPLSIELIARRFNVSAFHLNRVFRQVQGTTVIRFATDLRISVAKIILSGQPEQIADIARLTGFAGTASFCNVFRKHTGMTPLQYMKQCRKCEK